MNKQEREDRVHDAENKLTVAYKRLKDAEQMIIDAGAMIMAILQNGGDDE